MNGFDDLERQLRAKVTARAGRRRWPLMRTLAVAAALSVSAGAVTAAATAVIGGPGTEERAAALLDDVRSETERVPACRLHARDRRPAHVSSLPASDLARRSFPALRRDPTARERAFARKYGRASGMAQVLAGGARELRAGGYRMMVMFMAKPGRTYRIDPSCYPIRAAALERRAGDVDPAVLAAARAALERERRMQAANLGRESILIAPLDRDGRFAGFSATYTDVAVRRGAGEIGLTRVHAKPRLIIGGLVPTPADHVVIRSRSHPGRPSIRIDVPQQVFRVVLPARFGTRISVQWRAPDGRLLHVMKLRW